MMRPQPPARAPGQAPAAALPSMLAQQKGSTPPPQIEQLAQMPVDQLKHLFAQTMQSDTGMQPLTILAAIKPASKRQRMQQAMAGQAAQQQAAQQPGTVRDEVLAQAYAGGGIVALNSGGSTKNQMDAALEDWLNGLVYDASLHPGSPAKRQPKPEPERPVFTDTDIILSPEEGATRDVAQARSEQALSTVTPPTRDYPEPGPVRRAAQAPPAASPTQRPQAAPASAATTPRAGGARTQGGLDALIERYARQAAGGTDPRLEALGKTMEANALARGEALRSMQGLSPEEAAARARYYDTVRGAYDPQRKAMEEARASTRQGLLSNPEALARMAAAVSGKKRFGEALGAAAGSAGEFMGERRRRAEQLETQYQTLQSQLTITLAQAQRADAEGDEKRKRELLLQAQAIKDSLAQAQLELVKTGSEIQGRNVAGLAALTNARASERQAAAAQARAAQEDTQQRQVQRYAQLQQAINTSPKLRALAERMKMMPSPELSAEYAAEEQRIIRQWLPEMLNSAPAPASATGASLRYNPATGKIE